MMKIENDLLVDARQRQTPNMGGSITPHYLIMHYTAADSPDSAINWLCKAEAKASAHVVIARDGTITQLMPFTTKAWHAGVSHWDGLEGLNRYSIGIELDNSGRLSKTGSKFRSAYGKEYPEDQVIYAQHKNERVMSYWHVYTETQLSVALRLASTLVNVYGLKDILGHDDIAPGRKSDPGPAFPLAGIKGRVFGRADDEDARYEVAADQLNIRKGPGISYDTVAPPLARGTKLSLLESTDRWSYVDVSGENDIEGWVSSKFIRKL